MDDSYKRKGGKGQSAGLVLDKYWKKPYREDCTVFILRQEGRQYPWLKHDEFNSINSVVQSPDKIRDPDMKYLSQRDEAWDYYLG